MELNGAIVILHSLLFRRSPGVTNPRSDEAAEGRAGEDLGESGGHGLIEEKPRLLGEFLRLVLPVQLRAVECGRLHTLLFIDPKTRRVTLRHLRHLRHS